jgi:hypothetical protein
MFISVPSQHIILDKSHGAEFLWKSQCLTIQSLLCNTKFYYYVHIISLSDFMLTQMKSVHALTISLFENRFNIIVPS